MSYYFWPGGQSKKVPSREKKTTPQTRSVWLKLLYVCANAKAFIITRFKREQHVLTEGFWRMTGPSALVWRAVRDGFPFQIPVSRKNNFWDVVLHTPLAWPGPICVSLLQQTATASCYSKLPFFERYRNSLWSQSITCGDSQHNWWDLGDKPLTYEFNKITSRDVE